MNLSSLLFGPVGIGLPCFSFIQYILVRCPEDLFSPYYSTVRIPNSLSPSVVDSQTTEEFRALLIKSKTQPKDFSLKISKNRTPWRNDRIRLCQYQEVDSGLMNVLLLFLLKIHRNIEQILQKYGTIYVTVNRWLEHFINIHVFSRPLMTNNVFSRLSSFYEFNNLTLQKKCNYIYCCRFTTNMWLKIKKL